MVYRRAILLLICLWFANPAAADPCEDLSSQMGVTPSDSLVTMVFEYLWREREVRSIDTTGPLLFTSRSGFSVHPTCDGNVRIRSFLYYPMGLVVRDTGLRQTFIGQTFSLVESEYGFLLYIKQANLTPLEEGLTYLFANGNDVPPHCKTPEGCVVSVGETENSSGQTLNPKLRYGVAEAAPTGCQPARVTLYGPGHEQSRWADGQPAPQEYVPVCRPESDAPEAELVPNGQLKIVDVETYERLFDVPIRGKYERVSGNVLFRTVPNLTNVKRCGQKLTLRTEAESSAGLEVGGDYFILSGKLAAQFSVGAELATVYGEDVYLNSSAYAMSRIDDSDEPVLVTFSTDGAEPILTVMNCDPNGAKLLPHSFYMVQIYNDGFGSEPMVVGYQDLIRIAEGQANPRVAPGSLAGIVPASSDAMWRGQAWQIESYFEYFRLRDALRQSLEKTVLKRILRTVEADSETYERHVDYFAHLLMAVTTESQPE